MKTFYVTATWDNWPEGGSCGELILAETPSDAEEEMMDRMASYRLEEDEDTIESVREDYAYSWHIVDCYPLKTQILGIFDQLTLEEQQAVREAIA